MQMRQPWVLSSLGSSSGAAQASFQWKNWDLFLITSSSAQQEIKIVHKGKALIQENKKGSI